MIDWLTFRIPWMAPQFNTQRIMVIEPDGEVSWLKYKAFEVRGSWETNLHIKACPVTGRLHVDGNPTKFFQGHNLWGPDDPRTMVHATTRYLSDYLKLEIPAKTIDSTLYGAFELSRTDITEMFDLGTRQRARDGLRSIEYTGHMKGRRGGFTLSKGTVYSNKHSRRQSTKAYCKGDEISSKDHMLAGGLDHRELLQKYADGALRIEHVLRQLFLKDRLLHYGVTWTPSTAAELYAELLNKLELPDMIHLTDAALEGLSPRLQLAYDAWKAGKDLRALLPDRTFYRYRTELLKHGVDILLKQPSEPKSNVVPLRITLRATQMTIPDWARGTPLLWEPAKRA